MDTSSSSFFSSMTTSTGIEVNKKANKAFRIVSKPIRNPWNIIPKGRNSFCGKTLSDNSEPFSITIFLLKIVNRIRNNPETFNEDRLIAKAKKYCWVEKVWGPKVQLIGLIFNLTRYNLRFLYRMLNEYLLTNVYRCHSSNCLENKPFIFRQINQTSVV